MVIFNQNLNIYFRSGMVLFWWRQFDGLDRISLTHPSKININKNNTTPSIQYSVSVGNMSLHWNKVGGYLEVDFNSVGTEPYSNTNVLKYMYLISKCYQVRLLKYSAAVWKVSIH